MKAVRDLFLNPPSVVAKRLRSSKTNPAKTHVSPYPADRSNYA